MNWINTHKGNIINLATVSSIYVCKPYDREEWEVHADFPYAVGDSGHMTTAYEVISKHPSRESAQRALNDLYTRIVCGPIPNL